MTSGAPRLCVGADLDRVTRIAATLERGAVEYRDVAGEKSIDDPRPPRLARLDRVPVCEEDDRSRLVEFAWGHRIRYLAIVRSKTRIRGKPKAFATEIGRRRHQHIFGSCELLRPQSQSRPLDRLQSKVADHRIRPLRHVALQRQRAEPHRIFHSLGVQPQKVSAETRLGRRSEGDKNHRGRHPPKRTPLHSADRDGNPPIPETLIDPPYDSIELVRRSLHNRYEVQVGGKQLRGS